MEERYSAGIAIIKDFKVLLTKRAAAKEPCAGMWVLPAGRKELSDKTMEATAVREVGEEVGLKATIEGKIGEYRTQQENILRINYSFWGRASGEVQLDPKEVEEAKYFSYEETKGLIFGFRYKEVVEELYKKNLIR